MISLIFFPLIFRPFFINWFLPRGAGNWKSFISFKLGIGSHHHPLSAEFSQPAKIFSNTNFAQNSSQNCIWVDFWTNIRPGASGLDESGSFWLVPLSGWGWSPPSTPCDTGQCWAMLGDAEIFCIILRTKPYLRFHEPSFSTKLSYCAHLGLF